MGAESTPRRQLYRSEHAAAIKRHRGRMEHSDRTMSQRAGICEHPFGTMKRWLGWDHFLVRGFEKVRGEMAVLVNCYNFRRVLSLFGVEGFIAICEARRRSWEQAGACARHFRLLGTLLQLLWRLSKSVLHTVGIFSAPKIKTRLRPQMLAVAFFRGGQLRPV